MEATRTFMATLPSLPGSPHHQQLLQTIAGLYAQDQRVLAVIVFGSLGRGAGDDLSDLDVAVVIRDEAQVDIAHELERLKTALAEQGEQTLFTEVAGDDGYLLPASLIGIALNYHPLQAMSPYVLDGWQLIVGALEAETIRAAAQKNARPGPALTQQVHRVLWIALGVDIVLQRRLFWRAQQGLEQIRGGLLEIYAAGLGEKRAHQLFDEKASAALQAKFGRTLPQYMPESPAGSIRSASDAFLVLLHLLEHDLTALSNGQVQLGSGERAVIHKLQARQAVLRHDNS